MNKLDEYIVVDGYNIINNWENLKRESIYSLDSARIKLLDIMSNYQSYKGNKVIVVFDAHYVKNSSEKHEIVNEVHVVYTKENESADNYIERFVAENADKNIIIRVATSDFLEQRVVLGLGGSRMSARELEKEILDTEKKMDKAYINKLNHSGNPLVDHLDSEAFIKLEKIRRRKKF